MAKRAFNPFAVPGGWYRKRLDAREAFVKAQGREPTEGDEFQLKKLVRYTRDGLRALNEATFELGHEMIHYYVTTGKFPGFRVRKRLTVKANNTVARHVHKYQEDHPSFFSHLNPVHLISAAANVVSKVAPFVEMAVSLVPVAGQIYSVAKTAVNLGTALAKGRPLTDAFIDSAIGFLPGGPIAQRAARAVVALAKGRSLTGELLDQVKEQFPGAEHAISVAAGMVHGRSLQDAALSEVKSLAADQIRALKLPVPPDVNVPVHELDGFRIGLGVLNNAKLPSGIPLTPTTALAIRERLLPVAQSGFDRAMSMRALRNFRAGSPHVPPPRLEPSFRGVTFISEDGKAVVL